MQPGRDAVTLRLETTGVLTVAAALPSQGQRIMTALRQVASDELGMRLSDITSLTNDTATAPYGFGTFASRTAVFGSGAVIQAARELRRRILALGGLLLQASADELTIVDSVIQTLDRSKSLRLREMAEHSYFSAKHIPPELAYRYVAGYTIMNDLSERGLASKDPPRAERERDWFYDWLVGMRGQRVECVWPVAARGAVG